MDETLRVYLAELEPKPEPEPEPQSTFTRRSHAVCLPSSNSLATFYLAAYYTYLYVPRIHYKRFGALSR